MLETLDSDSRLIQNSGKEWVITPYGDDLRSMQLYYLSPDSVLLQKQSFEIQEVPAPDFVVKKSDGSPVEGRIAAGEVIYIESSSDAPLTTMDNRFQCQFASIILYKEKGDSTSSKSIRLEVSGYGNKLYFYTGNIQEMKAYPYGKIKLENIFRKNFRNKVLPYSGVVFEYPFEIVPQSVNALPETQESIAQFSYGGSYYLPSKFMPSEVRPEPINMDEIRKKIGYPVIAREAGIEGDFTLRILVSPEGKTEDYLIVKDVHPVLADQVTKVIHTLRFTPARLSGKNIYYWVVVPFKFRLG
ncbi:MAG: energy transducer TonB [Bacteroidia bacterium]|nr:energy transducer TonB [Bacteroidia bacterium]